jgi:hypothetical protein
MNFKELSNRVIEPVCQWTMLAGVAFLCQPWIEVLHRYSVTIMLIGLVGFIVFSHIKPEES